MNEEQPTEGATVIEVVQLEHVVIEELLAAVEAAAGAERKDAFERLAAYLAKHEAAEQQVVHPATETVDDEVAEERESEEDRADVKLAELGAMDADSPEFDEAFAEFRDAVLRHARHEEDEEHPKLERELTTEELEHMATEFAEAEAEAEAEADAEPD